MQYRKMNEDELKQYYNRYAHRYYVNVKGNGMYVHDCRSERNILGRSNLIFHLPMAGVLVNKIGNEYDIVTEMLPLPNLARLIWKGFSPQAKVLLGSAILGDDRKHFKSHFEIDFESKQAQYIYIRDLNRAPDALLKQAVHYHLGDQNSSAIISRYNHYVFPLGLSYRESDSVHGNMRKQYVIDRNQQSIKQSREAYQSYLRQNFGVLPLVEQQTMEDMQERGYVAQRYEDDLSCKRSFVIDELGRLLTPETSTDEKHFVGATMVATETWETVTKKTAILTYQSSCFSLPAEYGFEQRPNLSAEQSDRIIMLAKILQNQRREKASAAGMVGFLNTSSDENAWQV